MKKLIYHLQYRNIILQYIYKAQINKTLNFNVNLNNHKTLTLCISSQGQVLGLAVQSHALTMPRASIHLMRNIEGTWNTQTIMNATAKMDTAESNAKVIKCICLYMFPPTIRI